MHMLRWYSKCIIEGLYCIASNHCPGLLGTYHMRNFDLWFWWLCAGLPRWSIFDSLAHWSFYTVTVYVYFTPCPPNNGNSEPPLQIKLALQHHYTYISITCQSTKLTTIGWLLYSFVHTIYASSSLHSGWLHITSRLFLGKFGLLIVHVGAHWCTCNSLAI